MYDGSSLRPFLSVCLSVALISACDSDPTEPTEESGVVDVSAGHLHTCAIMAGGQAFCWGLNNAGQLGTGDAASRTSPALVASAVAFSTIRAGDEHTCALDEDGRAYCWGSNARGQLGTGDFSPSDTAVSVIGSLTFDALASGDARSCGLTAEGEAFCWGWNEFGRVGDGTTNNRVEPVAVAGGYRFASIVNWGVGCGIGEDGAAYCWGPNHTGQLGTNAADDVCGTLSCSTTPVAVSGGHTFALVASGYYHTCGITTGGETLCWGASPGNPTESGSVPTAIANAPTFRAVVAGAYHACGLTQDGVAYCWGGNAYGQLGSGTFASTLEQPTPVAGGLRYRALAAGGDHTCGITDDGELYCWGRNAEGQLGIGAQGHRSAPVRVTGLVD